MHFLYPCSPFERQRPDDAYAEEFDAVKLLGLPVSLFSYEDFEEGLLKPRPAIPGGETVVYRGWMMTIELYERLVSSLSDLGCVMLTSAEEYRSTHHMPEWLDACKGMTPETVVFKPPYDLLNSGYNAVELLGAGPYFVKDFVKSMGARDSLAATAADILGVVHKLKAHRGHIEGGVCVRKHVNIMGAEDRYFVVNGQPVGHEGEPPPLVFDIARRVKSPFYTVDIAPTVNRTHTMIELGDGQVSDRKSWPAEAMAKLLWALRHTTQARANRIAAGR